MAGFGQLIGLIVLVVFVAIAAYLGYHISVWSSELAERGRNKMEKKNMSFTKDGGLRVGVKDVGTEAYVDRTQNVLINTLRASQPDARPDLKGRSSSGQSTPRQSALRTTSATSNASRPSNSRTPSGVTSGTANLPVPEHRSYQRSSSPVPGSFD